MVKALTQVAAEKRKPDPKKRCEVPDGILPGLYLIIQPSGVKSWAVRYRLHGKPKKHTLGSFPALDLKVARKLGRDALEAVAQGRDPSVERKQARRDNADMRDEFQFVVEQFLERYAKPKNKSWVQTARTLGLKPDPQDAKKLIKTGGGVLAKWRGRRVQDIARRDVIELLDEISDRGAPIMANRTLAAIGRLFNWCKERDILAVSPCENVKGPGAERSRERVLSDEELRLLWNAVDADGWPFGPLVKLLILTGQRRAEVGEMRWDEIDAKGRTWTIPPERTKNKKSHEVPLSDTALAIIGKLPQIKGDAGLVFTTTGKTPLSGFTRAKDRLAVAVLEAGIKNGSEVKAPAHWTLHDIRRTVASGLARLGLPVHVTEAVLNHRSGTIKGVARIYNRYDYADEMRAALKAWERYVMTLVEGGSYNVIELRRALEDGR